MGIVTKYLGNDTHVVIPSTVKAIAKGAFNGKSLKTVVIPESVTSIAKGAFINCQNMTDAYILGTDTVLEAYCMGFAGAVPTKGAVRIDACIYTDPELCDETLLTIHSVANASVDAYVAAGDCYVDEDTGEPLITEFGYEALSFLLPAKLGDVDVMVPTDKQIPANLFFGCTNLTAVTIPEWVTGIGDSAFYGCKALKLVVINSEAVAKQLTSFSACGYLARYAKTVAVLNSITEVGSYLSENFAFVDAVVNGKTFKAYSKHAHTWVEIDGGAQCSSCGVENFACAMHDMTDATCEAPATCLNCGYTEGAALGHDIVLHEAKSPACTEIGWDAYVTCSRCDYTTYEEMPAIGHTEGKATCTAPAICERCDDILADALGHAMHDATCETALYCSRCGYTVGVPLGHDVISHDAKSPTCTENGWDAYVTCSRCDYTTFELRLALDHDRIYHPFKEPTCTENGWDAYTTCSRCSLNTYKEQPSLGHSMKDATCKDPSTCSRCDYTEGLALGHSMKAATCEDPSTCSRCDYTEGNALGHDMKAPTCEAPATCLRNCGHTEGDPLGHNYSEWEPIKLPSFVEDGIEACVCANDPSHVETRTLYHENYVTAWETGDVKARLFVDEKTEGKYVLHIVGEGAIGNYTSAGMPWYSYIDAICEVVIHEGIVAIGENVLRNATSLVKVTIPDSVTTIGASAFRGCTSLSDISAFENINTIGSYAFMNCASLRAVTIGENAAIAQTGLYVFAGCTKLTLVVVENPNVAKEIVAADSYSQLFSMIKTVSFPESITEVGSYIEKTFTKVETITQNGEAFTIYAEHSHASYMDTWEQTENGRICTVCGIEADPKPRYAIGDINGDGSINIIDITACVSAASGYTLDPDRYPGIADINGDGTVNIVDITTLVSLASGK